VPASDGAITIQVKASSTVDTLPAANGNLASNVLTINSDRTAPVISLIGDAALNLAVATTTFVDPGATALDAHDGNLTSKIATTTTPAPVTLTAPGSFTIKYSVTDAAGNTASTTRAVHVFDKTPPTVTLATSAVSPNNLSSIPVTVTFSKPVTGFDATDVTLVNASITAFTKVNELTYTMNLVPSADGTVTAVVHAGSLLDLAVPPNNNVESNTLSVVSNRTLPMIVLNGDAIVQNNIGNIYLDAGASVSSVNYPNLTVTPNTSAVNTGAEGVYKVTFDVTDPVGNHAHAERIVVVSNLTFSNEQSVNISTNSATIHWSTAHPATSRVVWDTVSHNPLMATSTNYGYANSSVEDVATTTEHSVTISGLNPGTTYYFRPISHGSPEIPGTEISVKTSAPTQPSSGGGGGNGPVAGSIGGGGGGGGGSAQGVSFYYNLGGSVLGASTSTSVSGTHSFRFDKNLRRGMRGDDVIELQRRLIADKNLEIDAPTGYFGPRTFGATQAFQRKHGVPATGFIGVLTRGKLNGDESSRETAMTVSADALSTKQKEVSDMIAALKKEKTGTPSASTTPLTATSSMVVASSSSQMVSSSTQAGATSTKSLATSTQQ
jgi:peptidoglycan hydrolase-like protein with peptidoglycan-binding domain